MAISTLKSHWHHFHSAAACTTMLAWFMTARSGGSREAPGRRPTFQIPWEDGGSSPEVNREQSRLPTVAKLAIHLLLFSSEAFIRHLSGPRRMALHTVFPSLPCRTVPSVRKM